MKQKIILITGIPGSGKTTLSYKLSVDLKIDTIINLDNLKIFLKAIGVKNKYVYSTSHEAYKIENTDVVTGYLKYSDAINYYANKVIKEVKDEIFIVEGVSVNETLINKIKLGQYDYILINLSTDKNTLIRRYKQKLKVRKGKWIENIDNIELIKLYLNRYKKYSSKNYERILRDVKKFIDN